MAARTWRPAKSLDTLLAETDALFPKRDHASDGSIGDPAHANRKSDHNPAPLPKSAQPPKRVVRARDYDRDGMDAGFFVEHLRKLGAAGDSRLNPGGYIIFAGRIVGGMTGWKWRRYTGQNRHDHHVHVSVSTRIAGYDKTSSWGLAKAWRALKVKAVQTARGDHPVRLGDFDRPGEVLVRGIQHALNVAHGSKVLVEDGQFGPASRDLLLVFQRNRPALADDGVVDADDLAELRKVVHR